jgi:hypothetical protein
MCGWKWIGSAAGAIALASAAAHGTQVTYGFTNVTNNGGIAANYNSQLSVTVSDEGLPANQVDFIFENDVGLDSSITDVYFDDGTLLGLASILSTAGVSFVANASPPNLPGGNTLPNPFNATFSADSTPPTVPNGVNASSESVTIRFDLMAGQTFNDVIAALNSGTDLRIGIHVQGQANGQSNTYITTFIPLPAGVWAGAAALAGLGGLGWLRRRSLRIEG